MPCLTSRGRTILSKGLGWAALTVAVTVLAASCGPDRDNTVGRNLFPLNHFTTTDTLTFVAESVFTYTRTLPTQGFVTGELGTRDGYSGGLVMLWDSLPTAWVDAQSVTLTLMLLAVDDSTAQNYTVRVDDLDTTAFDTLITSAIRPVGTLLTQLSVPLDTATAASAPIHALRIPLPVEWLHSRSTSAKRGLVITLDSTVAHPVRVNLREATAGPSQLVAIIRAVGDTANTTSPWTPFYDGPFYREPSADTLSVSALGRTARILFGDTLSKLGFVAINRAIVEWAIAPVDSPRYLQLSAEMAVAAGQDTDSLGKILTYRGQQIFVAGDSLVRIDVTGAYQNWLYSHTAGPMLELSVPTDRGFGRIHLRGAPRLRVTYTRPGATS